MLNSYFLLIFPYSSVGPFDRLFCLSLGGTVHHLDVVVDKRSRPHTETVTSMFCFKIFHILFQKSFSATFRYIIRFTSSF